MAEGGGRHDHFGVITAFENLQIRAAGKRGFDADADFARLERGRRDVLNLNFFPAVQDGGFHAGSLRVPADWRKQVLRIHPQSTKRPKPPSHRVYQLPMLLVTVPGGGTVQLKRIGTRAEGTPGGCLEGS